MKNILQGIRHTQWRWDYAAASHGASFHAPLEISRVIGTGINIAQETRIKLTRLLITLGFEGEVPYPDISTKAKAQEYIGLPMQKLIDEKNAFKQNLLPKWIEDAKQREAKYEIIKIE
jgi:nitrite reductase (cytochrome c-552)